MLNIAYSAIGEKQAKDERLQRRPQGCGAGSSISTSTLSQHCNYRSV
jgi:hypothetical protein